MNGVKKRPADLDSIPLDHKLYDVEESDRFSNSYRQSICLIFFWWVFWREIGRKWSSGPNAALAIYYRNSYSSAVHRKTSKFWRFLKINLSPNFTPGTPNLQQHCSGWYTTDLSRNWWVRIFWRVSEPDFIEIFNVFHRFSNITGYHLHRKSWFYKGKYSFSTNFGRILLGNLFLDK